MTQADVNYEGSHHSVKAALEQAVAKGMHLESKKLDSRPHLRDNYQMPKSLSASIAALMIFLIVTYGVCLELALGTREEVVELKQYLLDVNVMVYVGFGFLMTFLKNYSYSAVSFNFLAVALSSLLGVIIVGAVQQDTRDVKVKVGLALMIEGSFVAASAMIAFGAVIGKASPTQVVWLCALLVPAYAINQRIVFVELDALDVGGSMTIHVFGAFFGLAASWVLSKGVRQSGRDNAKNGAHYVSDIFSMVGTLFLFIYWPSFNGALANHYAVGGDEHTATQHSDGQFVGVINTILSITASAVGTFFFSALVGKKINMVHVQNCTLSGGVAMGSAAALNVSPVGAIVIGFVTSGFSVCTFQYLVPFLERTIDLKDTCGILGLHGIPGLIGGFVSAIAAYRKRSEQGYLMVRGSEQDSYQLAAVAVCLGMAIASGLTVGALMRFVNVFREPELNPEEMYEDEIFFTEAAKPWEEAHGAFHASSARTSASLPN